MANEVRAFTGAAHGEKTAARLAQRNGYGDRDWKTPGRDGGRAHPKVGQGSRRRPDSSNNG